MIEDLMVEARPAQRNERNANEMNARRRDPEKTFEIFMRVAGVSLPFGSLFLALLGHFGEGHAATKVPN